MDIQLEHRAWLEALLMVITDKPVSSWNDNDVLIFEIKLSEIARRFKNIEAIIELKSEENEGFEARKITVTYPTGKEINEVVWLDCQDQEEVKHIANKIFDGEMINNSDKINKAILAAIIERVFGKEVQIDTKDQMEKQKHG
jgi:hypothetical protein